MPEFGSKYVLIYRTTRDILTAPFSFAGQIANTPQSTKRAETYLGQGFLFFYSLLKLFNPAMGQTTTRTIPFGDELIALAIVAGALLFGLVVHPFAKAFMGSSARVHGTLSCFLYWTGFSVFVIPPIFAALLMGFDWLVPASTATENIKFFAILLVGVPFMFTYYLGTICFWVAKVHNGEPIIAGLAIITAYLVATGITAVMGWAVKTSLAFLGAV